MAPRHTQGVGGRHIVRRRISRAQQTKNWCVGFSFPPPAYAGIHPTLYLFGFRPTPPLLCRALIRVCLESASRVCCLAFREKGGGGDLESLRGPGAFGSLRGASEARLTLGWQTQKYQHFQAPSRGSLASDPPERPARDPEGQGGWV